MIIAVVISVTPIGTMTATLEVIRMAVVTVCPSAQILTIHMHIHINFMGALVQVRNNRMVTSMATTEVASHMNRLSEAIKEMENISIV